MAGLPLKLMERPSALASRSARHVGAMLVTSLEEQTQTRIYSCQFVYLPMQENLERSGTAGLPKVIVVLSDGWDDKASAVAAANAAKAKGISLVTVTGPVGTITNHPFATELMANEAMRRALMTEVSGAGPNLAFITPNFNQESLQVMADITARAVCTANAGVRCICALQSAMLRAASTQLS